MLGFSPSLNFTMHTLVNVTNFVNREDFSMLMVEKFSALMTHYSFPQVWEFDQGHQRWLPVAELVLPEEKGDQVFAVAWAPNIGRY